VPTTEDPVVVLAYGLGAWPSGADLTSLEALLTELDVSQPALLSRFESLIQTVPIANQNRQFRELGGLVRPGRFRATRRGDSCARQGPTAAGIDRNDQDTSAMTHTNLLILGA
jgi:hypothetical protein